MIYSGETGRSLSTRFKEHLADTIHHRDKPVAKHFNLPGHSSSSMHVKGLWPMFQSDTNRRKELEIFFINKLGTRKPNGLNDKA